MTELSDYRRLVEAPMIRAYEDRIRKLTEALAAAEQQVGREWLPVESAPRDETMADIFGYALQNSRLPQRYTECQFLDGRWRCWGDCGEEEPGWWIIARPTHWMPVPAPPITAAKEGE